MNSVNIFGVQIITSPRLVESRQFRFPRSKKKRIRKKWMRRSANFKNFPSRTILQIGGQWVMHPEILRQIKCKLNDDSVPQLIPTLLASL